MADYSSTTTDTDEPTRDDGRFVIPPKVEAAMKFVKHVLEVEGEQRKREMDDLAFQVPENAWTPEAKQARSGAVIGNLTAQPRPMVSIPKLDQPINGVINQAKNSQLGVNIHPTSEDATDDTAEVMRDLYRMIERDSRAPLARLWALARATYAGRGAYRVLTEYDHDSDHPFDQKIVIRRILRQEMAFFDTAAEEPDWRDGRKAAIGAWVPFPTLKEQHPKSKIAAVTDDEFSALVGDQPDWVRDTDGQQACFVVEYFEKVYVNETVWGFNNGAKPITGDAQPPNWSKANGDKKLTRPRCEVRWCKLTALDVLEEETLNGQYIPLIPVIGRELVPFGPERRWQGMVYPNRDAQRMFNAEASNALEKSSQSAKQSLWMAEGQQEGHETALQQANVRNFPFNLYKPVRDEAGNLLPPPFRMNSAAQDLAQHVELLQMAENYIQAGTNVVDPSALEKLARKRVAHQTLGQLADQTLTGNSDYLWNLAEISMTYESIVVLDLIPRIYDRPGRIAKLLNEEGDTRTVMLNQPFTLDPRTKRPIRYQAAQTPGAAAMGRPPAPPDSVKHYDLTKGKYAVSVSVGKSYRDRVEQGQDELGAILQAEPSLMPILGPIYFKFRDFPGHQEAADLMKRWRAMQFPGLDDGEDKVQQTQQEMAQLKAQMQALGEQYQQAVKYIETERAKYDAQIEIERAKFQAQTEMERIKADNAQQLQAMKDATAITVEEIKAATKGAQIDHEATHENLAMGLEHKHERQMAELGHEQAMASAGLAGAQQRDAAAVDREHAAAMQVGQQDFAASESQADRDAASVEAERGREAAAAAQQSEGDV